MCLSAKKDFFFLPSLLNMSANSLIMIRFPKKMTVYFHGDKVSGSSARERRRHAHVNVPRSAGAGLCDPPEPPEEMVQDPPDQIRNPRHLIDAGRTFQTPQPPSQGSKVPHLGKSYLKGLFFDLQIFIPNLALKHTLTHSVDFHT